MADSRQSMLGELSLDELVQQSELDIFGLDSAARVKLFQKQFKNIFQKLAWLEAALERGDMQPCRESLERIKLALTDSFYHLHEAWMVDNEQLELHRKMYDYIHALVSFIKQLEFIISKIENFTNQQQVASVEHLQLAITSADHVTRQFNLIGYLELYANILEQKFPSDEIWRAELRELLESHIALKAVIKEVESKIETYNLEHLPDELITGKVAEDLSVDDLLALKGTAKRYRGLFHPDDRYSNAIWRRQVIKLLGGDETAVGIFEAQLRKEGIEKIGYQRIAIRLQRYFHASRKMKEKDFKSGYAWPDHPILADKIDLLNTCLDQAGRSVLARQPLSLSAKDVEVICRYEFARCVMAGAESAFLALQDTVQAHPDIFNEYQTANLENTIIHLALFLGSVKWLKRYFDYSDVENSALNLGYMRAGKIVPEHHNDVLPHDQRYVKYLLEGLGQLKERYTDKRKHIAYLARLLRACCLSGYIDGARQIQTQVTEVDWRAITVSDYTNDISTDGSYTYPGRSLLFLAIATGDLDTVKDIIMNYYDHDYKELRRLIHTDGLGTSHAKTWERMILFSALLSGHRPIIEYTLGLDTLADGTKNPDSLVNLTCELIKKSTNASNLNTWLAIIRDRRPAAFSDVCKYVVNDTDEHGFLSRLQGDSRDFEALFNLLNARWDDPAYWSKLLKDALQNNSDSLASFVLLHCLKTKLLSPTEAEATLTEVAFSQYSATILDTLDLVQSEFSPSQKFWGDIFKSFQQFDERVVGSLLVFFSKNETRYAIWHSLLSTGVLNADEMYHSLLQMRANSVARNVSSQTITTFSVLLLITKLCQQTATAGDVFDVINSSYTLNDREILYQLIKIIQHQDAIGLNQHQSAMLTQGVTRLIQNLDGNPDNSLLLQAIIDYAKKILPKDATLRLSP